MTKGKDIKIEIGDDSAEAADAIEAVKVEYAAFRVLAEAGLFKAGQHYPPGETVMLTESAAAAFLAAGEVEPAEGEK